MVAAPASAKSIQLIAGSDEFIVKTVAAERARQLTPPEAGEFGLDLIEGEAENAEAALNILTRLQEALHTVGFFGGRKLVWLKNTNLLADNRITQTDAVRDALEKLAAVLERGLPAGVTLLISALGLDRRRKLCRLLEKIAAVELHDAPDLSKEAGEEEIAMFIAGKLRAEGKTMTDEALRAFRDLVAPTLRELANELEKLFLYVGRRTEITADDVRAVCSASQQAVIWELIDAIAAKQLRPALATLDKLLDSGEHPLGLLTRLGNQLRLILLARDLMERKVLVPSGNPFEYIRGFKNLPPEATAHFPRGKEGTLPNEWRMYRCALAARNFTTRELIRALDLVLDAHRQLVSTQLDERVVLTQTITRIIRPVA